MKMPYRTFEGYQKPYPWPRPTDRFFSSSDQT